MAKLVIFFVLLYLAERAKGSAQRAEESSLDNLLDEFTERDERFDVRDLESRRPPRVCDYAPLQSSPDGRAPVQGCSCWTRFGRVHISCVNLGLTNIVGAPNVSRNILVSLDLSGNNLRHLKKRIHKSGPVGMKLEKLVIRDNRGPSGAFTIANNTFSSDGIDALNYVDFTNSSLGSIPIELTDARNLRVLKLGYNNITVIPRYLSRFRKLETLELEANDINSIERRAFRRKTLKHLTLTVSNGYVSSTLNAHRNILPCGELTNLESLTFKNSSVEGKYLLYNVLKPECLPKLRAFVCEHCFLDDMSMRFVGRENGQRFEKISLRHNYLENQAMVNLLKASYGYGAGYKPFLPNLRELDLAYNDISTLLPFNVEWYLPSLEVLDLSHNRLTTVPRSYYKLQNLRELNLKFNSLSRVQMFDANWQLNHLQVSLEGNPIRCTCESKCMIERAKSQLGGAIGPFSLHDIERVTCEYPRSLNGTRIAMVTLDECDAQSQPVSKEDTDHVCPDDGSK